MLKLTKAIATYTKIPMLLAMWALSTNAFSDSTSNLPQRISQNLDIGISFSIPPWVIVESNSGIELDILKGAFKGTHYTVTPHYVPFALAYKMFDGKQLDGVINAQKHLAKQGYASNPVVTFNNIAISLKKKEFPKRIDIDFMKNKSIVAFQNANKILGTAFKKMSEKNGEYQEVSKQSLQLNLLFIREVDFIVMDKSIFGYFWNKVIKQSSNSMIKEKYTKAVRFHTVFAPTIYPFLFKDEPARDSFNRGFVRLKLSGEYDRIIKKYDHLTNLYRRYDVD